MRPASPPRARCALLVAAGLGLAVPSGLRAQEGCDLVSSQYVNVVNLPGIGRVTHIKRPHFVCEGGVQIFADSAAAQGDRGLSDLIGHVRYLESGRELRADRARYFTTEGRLQAQGNMSIRDEERGSSIENGDLVYLLVTDFRAEEDMTITTGADGVRPRATLLPPKREPPADTAAAEEVDTVAVPADSTLTGDTIPPSPDLPTPSEPEPPPLEEPADTTPPTPYTVIGDRIFLRGGRYFTAAGSVEIIRDSLFAFADSALYDQEGGALELEGSARVDGEAYELVGRRITMGSPGAAESEVHALRDARLVGDGFELTAAQIRVFLRDDALERLVATPLLPGPDADPDVAPDSADLVRPEAFVEQFELTADSLEILAPGEAIERVFAAGRARSESSARDSLNVDALPDVARKDWLEGDTIIITFVAVPGAAGASGMEVDEIRALVGARSLYRLPSTDSTAVAGTDAPAVHYVTGTEIRIDMVAGEVFGMQVTGQTRGLHFEPLQRSAARDTTAADTLAVPADTLAVPRDTMTAPPDTGTVVGASPAATRSNRRGPTHDSSSPARDPERPRLEERPWIRP